DCSRSVCEQFVEFIVSPATPSDRVCAQCRNAGRPWKRARGGRRSDRRRDILSHRDYRVRQRRRGGRDGWHGVEGYREKLRAGVEEDGARLGLRERNVGDGGKYAEVPRDDRLRLLEAATIRVYGHPNLDRGAHQVQRRG